MSLNYSIGCMKNSIESLKEQLQLINNDEVVRAVMEETISMLENELKLLEIELGKGGIKNEQ